MKSIKRSVRNLNDLTRAGNAAEDALAAVTLDDDDATVADAAAGWLLTRYLPIWKFGVIIDAYKKNHPHYPGRTFDHPYDWKYKNIRGIKTDDRDRAYAWITAVLLDGYSPHVYSRLGSWTGHCCGSIKGIRWNIENKEHVFSEASRRNRKGATT